jgi:Arc/MetJ-type ribon-helix-helix transcriptional regulator
VTIYHIGMATKPVTVTIDEVRLGRLDAWVRDGRYENRSKAIDAALELLERRNARPTLEWALAHPQLQPGSHAWEVARRDGEAIDAESDALNQPDHPELGSPAA